MKKTYIFPSLEVVELNMTSSMLAGSLPKSDTEITNQNEILSRRFVFDDDEEEY